MPELAEFEAITDHIVAAGNCGVDELTDASTAERAQIFDIIAEGRAGGARLLRKMPGAKDPPPQSEIKEKAELSKEIDFFASIEACGASLGGLRGILRSWQEAVNLSSAALYESSRACPTASL